MLEDVCLVNMHMSFAHTVISFAWPNYLLSLCPEENWDMFMNPGLIIWLTSFNLWLSINVATLMSCNSSRLCHEQKSNMVFSLIRNNERPGVWWLIHWWDWAISISSCLISMTKSVIFTDQLHPPKLGCCVPLVTTLSGNQALLKALQTEAW